MNRRITLIAIADDGTKTIYPSLTEAARAVGRSYQAIRNACKHGWKCAGMHWEHTEGYEVHYVRKQNHPQVVMTQQHQPQVSVEAVLSICGEYAEEARKHINKREVWKSFAKWYIRQSDLFIESNTIVRIAGYSPGVPPERGNMTGRDRTRESPCPSS